MLSMNRDEGAPAEEGSPDLNDGKHYINRELSSLEFNKRVLEEVRDESHTLLERVKFLAICGSNLDEFFMSRIADLRRQMARGVAKLAADGMPPAMTIDEARRMLLPLLDSHSSSWHGMLRQLLRQNGILVLSWSELEEGQRESLREMFQYEIHPTLTPLAFDVHRPFPFISNLSINLAISLRSPAGKEGFARVKVPTSTFPRFLRIPEEGLDEESAAGGRTFRFVLLEDLISANLDLLFPGMKILSAHPFRVTRDAEIEFQMDDVDDMLTAVTEGLESRRLGPPVRLEADARMPASILNMLASNLGLPGYLVFKQTPPFGLVDLWQLLAVNRPDLKDPPFVQYVPKDLGASQPLFSSLSARDHLLFHPYDSFSPVVTMLQQAAVDPDVLAIKITLYRIDKRSPVVDALIEARKNGKQVAAVVELKAKFDEENNISYARSMESEGVHVVYGPVELKVHAKMCLVVRKERHRILRYCHLSSGNYKDRKRHV